MTYIALHSKNENLSIYNTPTPTISKAYLLGALHDSTETKYTFRICQKSQEYINLIASQIIDTGFKAWTYKEGVNRNLYIVEFSKRDLVGIKILTSTQKRDYIRGYFDTEGGVPRNLKARYYIYFAQKDLEDLTQLKSYLQDLSISCGIIHIPSKRVDPNYYRFFILKESWKEFGHKIGSLHPEKSKYIRMKI